MVAKPGSEGRAQCATCRTLLSKIIEHRRTNLSYGVTSPSGGLNVQKPHYIGTGLARGYLNCGGNAKVASVKASRRSSNVTSYFLPLEDHDIAQRSNV